MPPSFSRASGRVLLASFAIFAAGCGGPAVSSIGALEANPQSAADEALKLYDANSDGALDASELKKSPALASATARIDADGDGKMTLEEIASRFEKYQSLSTHIPGEVYIADGKRWAAGAEVTFEPAPFMGSQVPTYTGVTGDNGVARMTSTPKTPGFVVGFYEVRVKKSDGTEVSKGCEIADDSGFSREIVIDIGS